MPLVPNPGFACTCGSDTFKIETRAKFHDSDRILVDETQRLAICIDCGKEYPVASRREIRLTEDL